MTVVGRDVDAARQVIADCRDGYRPCVEALLLVEVADLLDRVASGDLQVVPEVRSTLARVAGHLAAALFVRQVNGHVYTLARS